LQYLRARYYDPNAGRFISHDSFAGYVGLPQSQNPYTYGLNDPLRYTDPSGKCPPCILAAMVALGAVAGGGINLYQQYHNDNGNWNCINWSEVGISAGAGAVAVLVGLVAWEAILPTAGATLGSYILAGAASGVLAGQYARLTTYALSGQYERIGNVGTDMFNPENMLLDAVLGGVGGAAGYGIQSVVSNLLSGLSVGVPDEFLPPSMQSGELQPINVHPDNLSTALVLYDQEFARWQVIMALNRAVEPEINDIISVIDDEDAMIGARGSLIRGTVGNPEKILTFGQPVNLSNFDVDAFIISNKFASEFPETMNFRSGDMIGELATIQGQIDATLREMPEFSGLRPNEPFNFRVFTLEEAIRKFDNFELYWTGNSPK